MVRLFQRVDCLLLAALFVSCLTGGLGFYSNTPSVVDLSASTFRSQVLEGSDSNVWIVEFYAPWCGHCKNLAPAYNKVGHALDGTGVKVGAIDATKYENLAAQYGVQGFPTILLFGADKSKPTNYNGARSESALVEAGLKELKKTVMHRLNPSKKKGSSSSSSSSSSSGSVIDLADSTFDETVLDSPEMWVVAFIAPWCGHCKALAPEFASAAEQLEDTGINLASVDATANQKLSQRFGVNGYPTVKVFGPGTPKSDGDGIDYPGQRTAADIVSWAQMYFEQMGGVYKSEIAELVSQEVFESSCGKKKRCILAFLPDLRDTGKAGRETYIELLKESQKKARHVPFLWLAANSQPKWESLYNLQFGFPALLYLRTGGGSEKMGFVYQGKFEAAPISAFVSAGKNPNKAVLGWPDIETVVPWDFQEPEVIEEDDDFDLEAFLNDED